MRDTTFDIMKGIGILLVLLGHTWGCPAMTHTISSFHMPLFFIVAGYFAKGYSPDVNIGQTIVHYARRLIPPFLFTMILMLLWSVFMTIVKHGSWNGPIVGLISIFWADVNHLHTAWGDASIGVVWFLLALFWSKVLLLVLSKYEKWLLPIALCCSIGALLIHVVFPYSVWCLSLGLISFPFTALGWWCRRHQLPVWLKITGIIIWLVGLFFSELDMYEYRWGCYPIDFVGACGATYLVYFICAKIKDHQNNAAVSWLARIFAYIGEISLPIMCVHCFEMDAHLGNHLRTAIGLDLSPIWLYVFRYALTILLAVILTKLPYIKKIF